MSFYGGGGGGWLEGPVATRLVMHMNPSGVSFKRGPIGIVLSLSGKGHFSFELYIRDPCNCVIMEQS